MGDILLSDSDLIRVSATGHLVLQLPKNIPVSSP
jgi:hypothetical protein